MWQWRFKRIMTLPNHPLIVRTCQNWGIGHNCGNGWDQNPVLSCRLDRHIMKDQLYRALRVWGGYCPHPVDIILLIQSEDSSQALPTVVARRGCRILPSDSCSVFLASLSYAHHATVLKFAVTACQVSSSFRY